MSNQNLKVGDCVRLNSAIYYSSINDLAHPPVLTVSRILEDGRVECTYFYGGEFIGVLLNPNILYRLNQEEEC